MAGEEVDLRKSAQRATPHCSKSQSIWAKAEESKENGVVFLSGTDLYPASVCQILR
ncbi:hypothetical protein FOXYSP1_17275 [Fusarium oxysporum f. sp. phaseoli]